MRSWALPQVHDHQKAAGIVVQDTASVLFGVEGLQVTDAQALPDGTLEVWAVTGDPAAAACPDCGTVSGRRHDTVPARPRDVRRGGDPVAVWWVKRRWKCEAPGCPRKTFTERVPQVPPRCRLTRRLREQAWTEVAGRGITSAEAARHAGISWPVAHAAFAAAADPVLEQAPALVAHLGIDEHRRGRPRWRTGGTPAFLTCPAARGCWGRPKDVPPMTPRTGWPGPPPPDGTRSRSWRSTCAPSMPLRCAGSRLCGPPQGRTSVFWLPVWLPNGRKGADIRTPSCAPSATRTRDLLLRRHSRSTAWRRPVWPDVGSGCSDNGWI